MGMRQNIKLIYSNSVVDEPSNRNVEEKNIIYIYSHWGGEEGMSPLKMELKTALARKLRWDDEGYLARMIISEVLKNDIDGETGYAITPFETYSEYPIIVVDLQANTVDGISFEDFISDNY